MAELFVNLENNLRCYKFEIDNFSNCTSVLRTISFPEKIVGESKDNPPPLHVSSIPSIRYIQANRGRFEATLYIRVRPNVETFKCLFK